MADSVKKTSGSSSDSSDDKSGNISTNSPVKITSNATAAQGTAKEDTAPFTTTGQLSASDTNANATLAWSLKGDAIGKYGSLTVDATGKWTYTLNNSSAAVQALAEGESRKETFTVRVVDNKGAAADQPVTVTVSGTNDAPAIGLNALTIDGDSSSGKLKGTLQYTDPDQGDKHTSSVTLKPLVGSAGAPDLSASLNQALHASTNDDGNSGKGTVKWDFALPSGTPKLAAGQAVLADYQLSVADNHGGSSAPQDLNLLIVGTGSTSKVYSVAAHADLREQPGKTGSTAPDLASGVVSGKDLGLEDRGALSSALVMSSWSTGDPIPSAAAAALALALSTSTVPTSSGGESDKKIGWQFSAPDKTFDFLGAGETLTLAYRVASAKEQDGKSQIITLTVTGSNDAPVITSSAAAAAGAVQEDVTQSTTNQLAASDVDHGATQAWSVQGNTAGAYGSLGVNATTGQWTYALNNASAAVQALAAGESRNETFTVRVTDDQGATADQTVTVTVTGTNDAPVITSTAAAAAGAVREDNTQTATGQLTAGDVDHGATQAWTVQGNAAGAYGSLGVNVATGQWAYTLDNASAAVQALAAGETHDETFTVRITDDQGATADQTVTVTVTGTNDAPVITSTAAAAAGAVREDNTQTATGQLTAGDVDHGATQAWTVQGNAVGAYGSLGVNVATGQWAYTLDNASAATQALAAGETHDETFTVRVTDDQGATADQAVTVTVTGSNDAPIITSTAAAAVGVVTEDTTLSATGQLAASDVDHNATQAWSVVSANGTAGSSSGAYGSLSVDGSGKWTYALNNASAAVQALVASDHKTENFTVQVDDGQGGTATQNVSVTVNGIDKAPVAQNDSNALTVTTLASQVHSNYVNWAHWTGYTVTGHDSYGGNVGTVTGYIDVGTGQRVNVTYSGQFQFVQTNGTGTNYYTTPATLPGDTTLGTGTYTSTGVADGPSSSDVIALNFVGQTRTLTFSQPVNNLYFAVVSLNGNGYVFDQDFQVASYGRGYWGDGTLTRAPQTNGTYEVVGNGEPHGVLSINGTVQTLTWTGAGNENWNGFTVGTYGLAQTATASGNLLTNDSDPRSLPLAVKAVSVNGHETPMVGNSITLTLPSGADIQVNKDGSYLYNENSAYAALAQGESATDTLQYTVSNTQGLTANASLTVGITGVNDAPSITSGAAAAVGSVAEDGTLTAGGQLTASDPDHGATQAWSILSANGTNGSSSGAYGGLAVDSSGGWTYTLNNGSAAVQALAAGQQQTESFVVQVADGLGGTATQTVAVVVNGANDAPTAANDNVATNEDTPLTIAQAALLANDSDVDAGDSKVFVGLASAAQHGTVAVSGSDVVYTPAANSNGADSFTYTMRDAAGATSTATVNVAVNPVTDTYVLSNLAANGSFEASTNGWTVTGGGVDVVSSAGWQSADGAYSVDLNAFHPGGVTQVLQTTPGVQYTVGFDLSKNPGGHADHATVQVTAAGSSQSYTYSAANSASNMMWTQQTFTFTATGTTTTLSFASTYPNDGVSFQPWQFYAEGPALDEVVVVANKAIGNFTKGAGGDVLQLHDLLTSVSAPHDTAAFSGGYLRFLPSGGDTLVQIDSNGGGDAYLTVATLVGQSLSQTDTANYVL